MFSGTAAFHILSYSYPFRHKHTQVHAYTSHVTFTSIPVAMAPFSFSWLLSVCLLSSLPSVAVINTVIKKTTWVEKGSFQCTEYSEPSSEIQTGAQGRN